MSMRDFITRGAFLDAIADTVPLLIADMESGEILYTTRPLELMFGYFVHGELAGHPVEDLVPSAAKITHVQHRAAYAAHPTTRSMGQRHFQGVKRDGIEIPVEIGLSAAMIAGKRCAVAVVIDLSGRKQ